LLPKSKTFSFLTTKGEKDFIREYVVKLLQKKISTCRNNLLKLKVIVDVIADTDVFPECFNNTVRDQLKAFSKKLAQDLHNTPLPLGDGANASATTEEKESVPIPQTPTKPL